MAFLGHTSEYCGHFVLFCRCYSCKYLCIKVFHQQSSGDARKLQRMYVALSAFLGLYVYVRTNHALCKACRV